MLAAPSSANRSAVRLPNPLPAPVTKTFLPSNLRAMLALLNVSAGGSPRGWDDYVFLDQPKSPGRSGVAGHILPRRRHLRRGTGLFEGGFIVEPLLDKGFRFELSLQFPNHLGHDIAAQAGCLG